MESVLGLDEENHGYYEPAKELTGQQFLDEMHQQIQNFAKTPILPKMGNKDPLGMDFRCDSREKYHEHCTPVATVERFNRNVANTVNEMMPIMSPSEAALLIIID